MSINRTIRFATTGWQHFTPNCCNAWKRQSAMELENMGSRFSPFLQVNCSPSDYTQKRFLQTVRLKWMKNRGFDHIINKETDIRAVCMLKDIIKKHPGQSLPVSNVSKRQKELGLTIPVLRFMRRFPTIFKEFVGPKYNVPWFRLTEEVVDVDQEEQRISKEQEMDSVIRLCKLLMMTQSKKLSLQSLNLWKWDLGLPDDYAQTLIPKYPDYLSIVKMRMGILYRKAGTDGINSVKDRYPCKPEDSRYHDDREQLSGENASINISDSDESIYSGNDYSENYDEEISQEDDDMEFERRVSASGRQSSKKHS